MFTTLQARSLHPHTLDELDAVRTEMQGILLSVHFCNSKRYPAFLQYVVEQTLAGQGAMLKERTIGVEVFDRQATYDTNSDGVVRFTAGEVRKRLAAYYHDSPASRLRISLPLGTYVPDFSVESYPEVTCEHAATDEANHLGPSDHSRRVDHLPALEETPKTVLTGIPVVAVNTRDTVSGRNRALSGRRWILASAVAVLILSAAALFCFLHRGNPLDAFWQPFLHDRGTVLLCAGGNTLAQSQNAGLITADKATAYPYFSLQTAVSVDRLSSYIERGGSSPAFNFAASTSLPELHSHPIVLLNAYNNQWTLRLVDPLRFHFSPDTGSIPDQSIVDRNSPETHWKRDLSVPDSDTDDYALVARFRDTVTDNWVLVLAGLGRNGTDAASQFVTSPHYTQLLRDRIGRDLENRNVEVVLRVNVIDGKTGSPSIVATHVW
jgi:hypothetical protein